MPTLDVWLGLLLRLLIAAVTLGMVRLGFTSSAAMLALLHWAAFWGNGFQISIWVMLDQDTLGTPDGEQQPYLHECNCSRDVP
jgi:hypothetical protein